MINIDVIIVFVILNNEENISFYRILTYDDNCTFDLYVSYMSNNILFSQISNQWYVVISFTIIWKQTKNNIKFLFNFLVYISIGKFKIPIHPSSKHQTAKQKKVSSNHVRIDLNTVLNRQLQVTTSIHYCIKSVRVIFLNLDVTYSVFWLVTKLPCYCLLY